jgi:hypothetical protein
MLNHCQCSDWSLRLNNCTETVLSKSNRQMSGNGVNELECNCVFHRMQYLSLWCWIAVNHLDCLKLNDYMRKVYRSTVPLTWPVGPKHLHHWVHSVCTRYFIQILDTDCYYKPVNHGKYGRGMASSIRIAIEAAGHILIVGGQMLRASRPDLSYLLKTLNCTAC